MSISRTIPPALAGRPNWMGTKPGSKKPHSIRPGYNGEWMTAEAYADFPDVLDYLERGEIQRIGFVFQKDCGLICLDLDKVRDAETDDVAEWAQRVIDQFLGVAYIERSLSGRGFHIVFEGHKIEWMKATTVTIGHPDPESKFECFDEKFVILTGDIIEGSVREFGDGQEIFERIFAGFFPRDVDNCQQINGNEKELAVSALNGLNPKRADDYKFWLNIGMALHSVSADLLPEWEAWSHKSSKFIEGECQRKWKSFTGGQGISLGTLVYLAKQDGWKPPRKSFRRTDYGNAERLVHQHGADIRYCGPFHHWLVWDNRRWIEDLTGQIVQRAKQTVRAMYNELSTIENDAQRKAFVKFISVSESSPRLDASIKLSRDEVPLLPEALDTDPWLFNAVNGTIELREGKLREHRRDDLITKMCPVGFNPDAGTYQWDRFLEGIFGGDAALISFVQRLFGMCLTGDVSAQVLPILHGCGANGKSTFLRAVQDAMGPDYFMQAQPDLLLNKRNDSHPTERADLFGKRLVVCSEIGRGRHLNESLVKELTGGERVRARRMRQDFWEFDATHKVVICTNHRPTIAGTDHAIWRRIRLVPFNVIFSDNQQDKQLSAKLKAEAEGVLVWLVQGCQNWQREGLGEPPAVKEATTEYRQSQDVLAEFMAEKCCIGDGFECKASHLYQAFKCWSEANGDKPISGRRFGEALLEHGFSKHTSNGVRWERIGLLTTHDH